jgi:hypothetical protein
VHATVLMAVAQRSAPIAKASITRCWKAVSIASISLLDHEFIGHS